MHTVVFVVLADFPAAQSVHEEAELDENLPLEQSEHTDCLGDEKVPAVQAMHEELAAAEENVPATQSAQDLWQTSKLVHAGLKVPIEQSEQNVEPAVKLCFPDAQISQVEEPTMDWNLPLTQAVQTRTPVDGDEYVPASQDVHEDEPEVENLPSAQSAQELDPETELNFPASHAVQDVKSVML